MSEEKTVPKVSAEVAEAEFERLVKGWDLDVDPEFMDEADVEGLKPLKRRIVRDLIRGNAVVSENGRSVTYTIQDTEEFEALKELEFKVPKGSAIASFDRTKEQQQIAKLNLYMAAMTGQSSKIFSQMSEIDLKFCRALVTLFLGS